MKRAEEVRIQKSHLFVEQMTICLKVVDFYAKPGVLSSRRRQSLSQDWSRRSCRRKGWPLDVGQEANTDDLLIRHVPGRRNFAKHALASSRFSSGLLGMQYAARICNEQSIIIIRGKWARKHERRISRSRGFSLENRDGRHRRSAHAVIWKWGMKAVIGN